MPDGTVIQEHSDPGLEPTTRRRVLIVANRAAGRGTDPCDEAVGALQGQGCECVLERPESVITLQRTIREARAHYDAVVIAGGDGTLHAALPALIGPGAPIGILPLGTANDFARTLNLPLDPVDAARLVLTGRIEAIDVGWVGDEPFFNVAHVGVGARAEKAMSRERKRRWRALSYPISLIESLWNFRPFRVWLEVDGHTLRFWAVHVAVGNGRYFGGGVPVTAEASIQDGLLDVYCVRAGGYWALFLAGYAVWRGETLSDAVWRASGKAVHLATTRPHRITADGEASGMTPVSFRVEPAVVPVIVGDLA